MGTRSHNNGNKIIPHAAADHHHPPDIVVTSATSTDNLPHANLNPKKRLRDGGEKQTHEWPQRHGLAQQHPHQEAQIQNNPGGGRGGGGGGGCSTSSLGTQEPPYVDHHQINHHRSRSLWGPRDHHIVDPRVRRDDDDDHDDDDYDNVLLHHRDGHSQHRDSSAPLAIYPSSHGNVSASLLSLDDMDGPVWLKQFVHTRSFFDPCPSHHHKPITHFTWNFGRGVGKGLCIKCVYKHQQCSSTSSSSIYLQVRKASCQHSINKEDLTRYVDTSGIFTLIINGKDIHYLRPSEKPIKQQKGAKACCRVCKRTLKEKRENEIVCSIQCKLVALKHGIMPPHLSRLEKANVFLDDHFEDIGDESQSESAELLQFLRQHDIDVNKKNCLLKLVLKLERFDESSITEDWKRGILQRLSSM